MSVMPSALTAAARMLAVYPRAFAPSAVRSMSTDIDQDGRWLSQAVDQSTPNSAVPGAQPEDSAKEAARHARKRLAPFFNNSVGVETARLPDGARVPWTPSSQLDKRKTYQRRTKHILNVLDQEYTALVAEEKRTFPSFKAGDVITVALVVPENDMRPTTFTGICMGIKRNGSMTRFRMRNTIKGTGPVERTFLLYSPFLKGVTVKRSIPVRRAKLTYLRDRKDAQNTF